MHAACSRSATPSSTLATTAAAGWRAAISLARFGPETTATRSAGMSATSQMTWLIRRLVPSSMPFIRLTRTERSGSSPTQPLRFSRNDCDGTARTTSSAPSNAALASGVQRNSDGKCTPGR